MGGATPLEQLVDLERGEVGREIFVDESIYRQELERIFARAWLFIGHESQIPKPGDYVASYMGEESVILTRDDNGAIHVLLNTCRHRGMKVCRYDEGNTRVFTCAYHGWSYATDGRLVGVPREREGYGRRLDRKRWGLIEVAQLTNYKGTIWATWDEAAPALMEYLGDMKPHLDRVLDAEDGSEGGSDLIAGVQKWRLPCNWKFPVENFSCDFYHGATTHPSVDAANIAASGQRRREPGPRSAVRVHLSFPDLGHSTGTFFQREEEPAPPRYADHPVVRDYFKRAYEARQQRLGKWARLQGGSGLIFPNMGFLKEPPTIAVWHPRGPFMTEMWRFYLVDREAPKEVKDLLRHYAMRYSGPAGMTEQDDMENWQYATAASRGVIARRYPYNYQMGLGVEQSDYGLKAEYGIKAVVTSPYTEYTQRGLFKRWLEFMQADSWKDLRPKAARTSLVSDPSNEVDRERNVGGG